MLRDFAFAFRTMRRSPGFAITAILALAAGIGANSAMFSVIDGVLLRPLPFQNPDRLVNIWEVDLQRNIPRFPAPVGNYLDWRTMNHVLSSMGAYTQTAFSLSSSTEPERYIGALSDSGLFPTLGVNPVLGRPFNGEDDLPGRDNVAIIGYGLWKQRFGGDSHILGRQIILDGKSRTIVGVMPLGFSYPVQSVVWVPFGWNDETRGRRDFHNIRVVGRLRDGVSLEQARTDFLSIAANLDRLYPFFNQSEKIAVNPVLEDLVGQSRPSLILLLGAAGFVLLIACANVANLQLAKAAGRARELAIRASLGAPRMRLLKQLLTESLLLSSMGGLVGLLLAYGAIQTILALAPSTIPRLADVHLDWRALSFTSVLSVFTGVVFGILPAWRASRPDVQSVLKEGQRGSTANGRLRSSLVVIQVVAAVVFLAGAGLLIRSFYALLNVDAGFDASHVMTMRLTPAPLKYSGHPELQIQLGRDILRNVAALPGVRMAAIATDVPLAGNPIYIMRLEGQNVTPSQAPVTNYFSVTPSYFETMHMRLLEGRWLNDGDIAGSPLAVVINQTLARKYFPGQSPLGKRLEVGFAVPPRWRQIVGVVADVHSDGLDLQTPIQVYAAYLQVPGVFPSFTPAITVVAKTSQDPAAAGPAIKKAILDADRAQPVFAIQTMDEVVGKSIAQRRFALALIAIFAALALFLAALGLYGVISYSVAQRTSEIGIRIALGAKSSQVLWMVERQGLLLVGIGLILGTVAALALTRFLEKMLFGVSPTDPLTYLGVASLLLSVAAAACYIPARRAARVDPMVALRYE
jgi:putative ABC transport system permease protein